MFYIFSRGPCTLWTFLPTVTGKGTTQTTIPKPELRAFLLCVWHLPCWLLKEQPLWSMRGRSDRGMTIKQHWHRPFFRTPSLFHCADTHASCHLEDLPRNGTCSLLLLVVRICILKLLNEPKPNQPIYFASTWTNRNQKHIIPLQTIS